MAEQRSSSVPSKVLLYHVTHYSNLPGIIRLGGILCDARLEELFGEVSHVNIAYGQIKQRRAMTPAPCVPNHTVANYVPFYFAPRSPMLYAIHAGFVSGYTGGQDEIIY